MVWKNFPKTDGHFFKFNLIENLSINEQEKKK